MARPVASPATIGEYLIDEGWDYFGEGPHRWLNPVITYNVQSLDADQAVAARLAFAEWQKVCNLTFQETTGAGLITFENDVFLQADGTIARKAYCQDVHYEGIIFGATINVSTGWEPSYDVGTYGFQTFVHEIGHALGLAHAGPYNAGDEIFGIPVDPELFRKFENDTRQYSVMSYNEQSIYNGQSDANVSTPMLADIYAIQNVYGARASNNSDTRYVWGNTTDHAETIYDSGGRDTIDISQTFADSLIDLRGGTNFSSINGRTGILAIYDGTVIEVVSGGRARDTIIGNDVANAISGNNGNDEISGAAGDDSIAGGQGADRVSGGYGRDTVFGEGEDDLLYGDDGDDSLYGGGGNDRLSGNNHADTLNGDAGNDAMYWSEGADTFNGGDGFDLVDYWGSASAVLVTIGGDRSANFGTDAVGDYIGLDVEQLYGSNIGGDLLRGSAGDNALHGHGGDDGLTAFGGRDVLYGDAGNDQLFGGEGDDQLNGGTGLDKYFGGNGSDTVRFSGLTGVQARIGGQAYGGEAAGESIDSSIENLWGTEAGDTLNGSAIRNILTGDAGSDLLHGEAGDDAIDGGAGDDTLDGGAGADSIFGGTGVDTVNYTLSGAVDITIGQYSRGGNAEGDILWTDIENIGGSYNYNDIIRGWSNDNRLSGSGGSDTLFGLGGSDTLVGDSGNDVLAGGAGGDRLDGGSGIDTASYALSAAGVTVTVNGSASRGDAAGDDLTGIENLTGSSHDDVLTSDPGVNRLDGSAGNDRIVGGLGADTLIGGAGVDWLSYQLSFRARVAVSLWDGSIGSAGDAAGDVVTGFENLVGTRLDDALSGSGGANTLDGGSGKDTLSGGKGRDTTIGGAGNDTHIVNAASDIVVEAAGGGTDTVAAIVGYALAAGVSVEVLAAAAPAATTAIDLTGNELANVVSGNAGANLLVGRAGDDRLSGGAGADILRGGVGEDVLGGGSGADRFTFLAVTESRTADGRDLILDFARGQDRIDLATIDANATLAGDQAFKFIGTALFSNVAGQLRYGGGDTVTGDVNGDGHADFHIHLSGVAALSAADFLL